MYKRGYTIVQEDEKRVIDSNEVIARKLKGIIRSTSTQETIVSEGDFTLGLQAERLELLLEDNEGEIPEELETQEPVYQGPTVEEMRQQAEAEIEQMKAEAESIITAERIRAIEESKKMGYQEGYAKVQAEFQKKEQELEAEKARLEEWYQKQAEALEPQFIDTLTGIYEHVFRVELKHYREIIIHLINETLRKSDGNRDFIIRVSKEDYPYVSMQKRQIISDAGLSNATVEIVEDIILGKNECMIETESGIFDCGLETQLAELTRKLKLLSYEKIKE